MLNPFSQDRLKGIEVVTYPTLFPPQWEALQESRCPLCSNKLKFPRNSKIALCSSNKHGKPFVISIAKFKELTNT